MTGYKMNIIDRHHNIHYLTRHIKLLFSKINKIHIKIRKICFEWQNIVIIKFRAIIFDPLHFDSVSWKIEKKIFLFHVKLMYPQFKNAIS